VHNLLRTILLIQDKPTGEVSGDLFHPGKCRGE
jgi:hypothetical protein